MSAAAWISLSLRVLLGVWFVYSGGYKLWVKGLHGFAGDIENYQLLPSSLVFPAACLVSWLEIIAGFCLAAGLWLRGAVLVMAGLVIGFMVFIGWAWQHQLDIRCGCQGGDEPIRYWWKAIELPAYLLVLGWLWWRECRKPVPPAQKKQNMA